MSQENRKRCQKEKQEKRQRKPFSQKPQDHRVEVQSMVQGDRNKQTAEDWEMGLGLSRGDED